MQNTLLDYMTTWGSLDIATADNFIEEYNLDFGEVAEYIEQFAEETETNVFKLDPVAMAYEFLLNKIREEIEELTGIDILNDTKSQIYVAGNYCGTSFDMSDEAKEELKTIINKIKTEDRSEQLTTFINNELE